MFVGYRGRASVQIKRGDVGGGSQRLLLNHNRGHDDRNVALLVVVVGINSLAFVL